jgi:predicted HicB family RNase H-like nuclease
LEVQELALFSLLGGGRNPLMPGGDEVWVQLATRIPKGLHRDLKLHCVEAETSVMDFVTKAIEEKLRQLSSGSRAARPRGRRAK